MKSLLLSLVLIPCLAWGQKTIYSIEQNFSIDTVFSKTEEGWITKYFKIEIDSSSWRLYRIKSDTFFYFKIYSYGTQLDIDYPSDSLDKWEKECPRCITMSGWSDAVGRIDKSYMKTNWLLNDSKISDTIPEPTYHYSEFINADNPNAAYGHTIIKYYVGGIFGEFIREEHLNDAKKKPKNKN